MKILRYSEFNLNEDKLYGINIINQIMNKLGDNSTETKNKINIFALFRNKIPFNGKNIQNINLDELNDLYNTQYNNIINTFDTEFTAKSKDLNLYFDTYINKISELKDKAKPFNNPDELINIVETNNQVVSTQSTEISIENPNPKDIILDNDNIIIINTDTHLKCQLYGKDELWCISGTGNYYNGYRVDDKATIYMVYQKNVDEPNRKLVVMIYPEGYSIADQTNSTDKKRAGLKKHAVSQKQVEEDFPNLKGLKDMFKPNPLTDSEIKYMMLLENPYVDDNLFVYLSKACKGLVVNGKEVNVYDCFRDYVKKFKDDITTEQVLLFDEKCISIAIECFYDFFELTYTQFLNKFNNTQQNRYLKLHKEHNYPENNIIHKTDEKVHIGNYNCSNKGLTTLVGLNIPKFIKGSFDCSNNPKLESLEGAPTNVGGDFVCYNNPKLESLVGAPTHVGRDFYCSYDKLTSLEGAPTHVGRDFYCSYNKLTSLEGAPTNVGRDFVCYNNQLTSLEGAPTNVGGDFQCSNNQLKSLVGAPNIVEGYFDCSDNNLTSLEGAPNIVEGYFDCSNNNLTSLEGAPTNVGGDFQCSNNPKLPKEEIERYKNSDAVKGKFKHD